MLLVAVRLRGRINLTARAEPRDASVFTLRTPIEIAGTFLDPQIKPRKGPLAARGVAAIALRSITPLLAIIPFVDPGGDPRRRLPAAEALVSASTASGD